MTTTTAPTPAPVIGVDEFSIRFSDASRANVRPAELHFRSSDEMETGSDHGVLQVRLVGRRRPRHRDRGSEEQ